RRTPARPGSPRTPSTRTRCRTWSGRTPRTPRRWPAPASPRRWWWRPRAPPPATARTRRPRPRSHEPLIRLVGRVGFPVWLEVADSLVAPYRPHPHAHPHLAGVAAQHQVPERDVSPVQEDGRGHVGGRDPLAR